MRTHHISAGLALCVALLFSSIADAQSVNLSWQANSENDLAGYRVYYGTSSRSYGPAIPVGNVTQYEVTGLDAGQTYYFAVTAVDTSGNESGYSQEDSATASAPPDTSSPTLAIISPTTAASYTATGNTITLAGSASDDTGVSSVSWQNASGGSGTASGTTSWSIADIALSEGSNVITVTAADAAGNQTSDTLTVTYTIPVVAPPTPPPAPEPTIEPTTSASSEEQKGFTSILSQVLQAYRQKIKAQAAALAARLNRSQTSPVEDIDGPGVDSETSTYQNTETTDRSYVTTSGTSEAISPVISIVSPTTEGEYDTVYPEIDLAGTTADSTEVLQVRWSTSNGDQGVAEGTASWEVTGIPLVEGDNIITVTAVGVAENTYVHEMTVRYMP